MKRLCRIVVVATTDKLASKVSNDVGLIVEWRVMRARGTVPAASREGTAVADLVLLGNDCG